MVSIPHPGKIQLPAQLKSLRRENLNALFHSLSRHVKLTGRSLRPHEGSTKRAPGPPNVALSRCVQSATRHDTSHHGVSVERGCSVLWSRIVPHLGRAELNFKGRVPTRPAARPHSGLPGRSRDSHRRGQEAACAVQGLGCRARSPLSPGPGPSPRPRSPNSSSLTSRAAFSPSSRRLRSIILLRSTAALSSALNVQPMVAERRRALGAGTGWQSEERLARRRPRYVLSSGKLEARSASPHAAASGDSP